MNSGLSGERLRFLQLIETMVRNVSNFHTFHHSAIVWRKVSETKLVFYMWRQHALYFFGWRMTYRLAINLILFMQFLALTVRNVILDKPNNSWRTEPDKMNMIVMTHLEIRLGWLLWQLIGFSKAIVSILHLLKFSITSPTSLRKILVKWFKSKLMTINDTKNLSQIYSNILSLSFSV